MRLKANTETGTGTGTGRKKRKRVSVSGSERERVRASGEDNVTEQSCNVNCQSTQLPRSRRHWLPKAQMPSPSNCWQAALHCRRSQPVVPTQTHTREHQGSITLPYIFFLFFSLFFSSCSSVNLTLPISIAQLCASRAEPLYRNWNFAH